MNAHNRKSIRVVSWVIAIALIQAQIAFAQMRQITVQVDKPGAAVPKTLFGLFFEDINFGADGGLYPERVKNRSFEFPDPWMGWRKIASEKGTLKVLDEKPLNVNNPHYLRLEVATGERRLGVANEGFRGMGVEKGAPYIFSVYARRAEGGPADLRVEIEDEQGNKLGGARFAGFTPQWKKYSTLVRPTGTSLKARLNLIAEGGGAI